MENWNNFTNPCRHEKSHTFLEVSLIVGGGEFGWLYVRVSPTISVEPADSVQFAVILITFKWSNCVAVFLM
jgi:hypothetical protein